MRRRGRALRVLGICFILAWSLVPIYWAINSSLQTDAEQGSRPTHYVPTPITFGNYRMLLGGGDVSHEILRALLNSTIECGLATIGSVLVATLAAYAFARLAFRGKQLCFYILLATMALPAYARLIPVYRLLADIGLVNTYSGIVLVYISGFMPVSTWIMYNYFGSLPLSIEEAGRIDGASRLQILSRLMLPLARPGIISTTVIAFLFGWGAFLLPLVLSTDLSTEPLSVAISALQGKYLVPYTLLSAAGVLAISVPAVITLALNRYIVDGLLAGSVK